MSGTNIAYGGLESGERAMCYREGNNRERLGRTIRIVLRARYAMSGTDLDCATAAIRSLCDVRY
eukprot:525153-Rhodomonas_salina.2